MNTNAVDLSLTKKFINLLMINGEKNKAYKIFCAAGYEFFQHSVGAAPTAVVQRDALHLRLSIAVGNVQPSVECRKCRVAGTSRLVPAIVSEKRGRTLAVRWIIESARKRRKNSTLSLSQCLAQELHDAYMQQGRPRQRRDQYHKLSQGNRGALRYRWW